MHATKQSFRRTQQDIPQKSSPDIAVGPLCRSSSGGWKVNEWASILETLPPLLVGVLVGYPTDARLLLLLLVRLLVLPYPLAGALFLPPSSHLTRAGTALAQAASLRFASLLGVRPMRHFTLCRPTPPRTCAGSKPAYMRGATHPSTTAALGRCHQPHTPPTTGLALAPWCAWCAFALACPRLSSPFPTHLLGVYLAKLCALSLPNYRPSRTPRICHNHGW